MKAALLYGREDLRVEEVTCPPAGARGLGMRVLSAGICGSDARMFFTGPTPRYLNPVILGHELCGEITEVGSEVEGYGLGDLVTVAPVIPCMRCASCARGDDNLCKDSGVIGCTIHGGFAEHMTIPAQMVHAGGVVHVPQGISHREACLTEVVGCCLHGLRQISMSPGDRVLIIGDGAIGLTFLQLCRLMGAGLVVTSGRRPRRRQLAVDLGADQALDASEVQLTQLFERSFDRVIVAASSVEATSEALELVRPGGDLLLFSGYAQGSRLPLDVNEVHYGELHIHGSIDCTIRDFRAAARILPQLRMETMITGSYPLERVLEAFQATRERDAVKIVVEP